ncbi:hypothetical protein BH11ARM2_BH11ARM2_01310 [soil metagenome]
MIALVASLALGGAGYRFGGGDDLALLRSLRSREEGPLVSIAYKERLSVFSFTTDDRFWSRFQRETNRSREGETGVALQRGDYPAPAFGSRGPAASLVDFDPDSFVAGGRVSGESTGPFLAGNLSRAKWSKTLRIHYVYREIPIVALGQGASETAFLKTLAAAIGGRFVNTDSYEIRLDPAEFRSRLVRTIDSWRRRLAKRPVQRDAEVARTAIFREAIASMSDDEISKAFASPTSSGRVGKPSPVLRQAIKTYFATLADLSRLSGTRPVDRKRAEMLQDIDPDKPMVVDVYGDFFLFLGVPKRGGGTLAF